MQRAERQLCADWPSGFICQQEAGDLISFDQWRARVSLPASMTVAEFFGCGLIAFGPPASMFALTIAHDPIRTIMLVASAFFWLLALLFSSILYCAVVQLQDTFLWFLLIQKAEGGLKKVSDGNVQIVENKHILAYVSGLGFGIISGAFSLVNVLADMTGPGTIGLFHDPQNFFVASAMTSLAFILLHVFWGILFFNAIHRRVYLQLAYVILCHLLASCITLLNPRYSITLPTIWILTGLSGVFAFIVAGGSHRTIRAAVKGTTTTTSSTRVLQVNHSSLLSIHEERYSIMTITCKNNHLVPSPPY
ncbi:Gamma-secretase subunit Aph-1 [Portunus trituberculatus]|uniref:Gamma-secretase subunit Aph-1 n=1 Tax=Portunus trituberculatus TaxID=210409 RepID=A0A5B7DQV5_PORTR|nr:Gamma-secretase subunit Aph-1 [Portunus trituberculatus]